MENILFGCSIAAIGIWAIISREKFAHNALVFQKKKFGIDFSKKTLDWHIKLLVPFGLLFVAYGITMALGLSDHLPQWLQTTNR